MFLKELINRLEKEDKNKKVPVGFNNPHSYRGYYHELGVEPVENTTVGEMLECCKQALGTEYQGYKGGWFEMNEYSSVYLAKYSETGEEIGNVLLDYMLGKYN